MIIPLEESVLSTDIPHFWYALNKTFGSMGDEATKDSARMYYMPGTFPGAFSFIFKETSKKLLNPKKIMKAFPRITSRNSLELPKEFAKKYNEYKKKQYHNTDQIFWNTVNDCPFVHQETIDSFLCLRNGRHMPLFSVMCSIASRAKKKGYLMSPKELSTIASEIYAMSPGKKRNRNFDQESRNAVEIIYELRS